MFRHVTESKWNLFFMLKLKPKFLGLNWLPEQLVRQLLLELGEPHDSADRGRLGRAAVDLDRRLHAVHGIKFAVSSSLRRRFVSSQVS